MDKQPYHVVSWSGGKDSTATIILAHELGLPIDLIIISIPFFDKERGIYAERSDVIDWIKNTAKPIFESWGYPVKIVSSDKDYLYYFWKIREKSEKHPEHIGKYYGFLIGGACVFQQEKVRPIKQYLAPFKRRYEIKEYVGICFDEPKRLDRVHNRKDQISLLEQQKKTQNDAKMKCAEYGLLSPTYTEGRKRGGCWFCPNQSIAELAALKQTDPGKWNELEVLSREKNTVSRGFKYGVPFEEINEKVDVYIENQQRQISLFKI